ncbi:MAG: hypothetical protein JRS35_28850, partial [Deltaproteobacteria bacterium]|nr:hypothetical protein [Deltaproteobacteria bacterium]
MADADRRLAPDGASVVMFSGKGGVGKTTCAAATALHHASRGERTLAISTDPGPWLSQPTQRHRSPTSSRPPAPGSRRGFATRCTSVSWGWRRSSKCGTRSSAKRSTTSSPPSWISATTSLSSSQPLSCPVSARSSWLTTSGSWPRAATTAASC